jgi:hypothetical protein
MMWIVGALVSAVAIWRGEVLARQPNPDMTDLSKRVDGLYDHIFNIVERIAKIEATLDATMVDTSEPKDPDAGKDKA